MSDRRYLEGAIAALEMLATRNCSDGPGAQKYVAMADIHGLLLIFNQDLKALPLPAPCCLTCGNPLDGGVAPDHQPSPAQPDWRGLVEECDNSMSRALAFLNTVYMAKLIPNYSPDHGRLIEALRQLNDTLAKLRSAKGGPG